MEDLPDIDVYVGNITYIDFEVYDMWLLHLEADEARDRIRKLYADKYEDTEENPLFLYTYVLDHFRMFGMLEPILHNPIMLSSQMTFQISAESQKKLITKYYQFDEHIVRELLGKKLSKGTRRDLDEIASKTKTKLKSCQRQFDNCRRVLKVMEDKPGRLVDNIQKHFLLPLELAWNYSAIVFLANERLECNKRKLLSLTFKQFMECSKVLLDSWTYCSTDTPTQDADIELDQEFLHELRGVKVLTSDQKLFEKHRLLTLQTVKSRMQEVSTESELVWSDGLFRQLSRGIIGVASSLYKTKDMRNYFLDILEKVLEPCKSAGWDNAKLETFLECYSSATVSLPLQNLSSSLNRYLTTTSKCILELYR